MRAIPSLLATGLMLLSCEPVDDAADLDAGPEADGAAQCTTGINEAAAGVCRDDCDNDGDEYVDCGDLSCCVFRSDCAGGTFCGDRGLGVSFSEPLRFDDNGIRSLNPRFLPAGAEPCRAPVLVNVTHVSDGDTLSVSAVDGALSGDVRVVGVDTPEVAHEGDPAECYGDDARAFARQLDGHLLWLTFDLECEDRFGRILAYVHLGEGANDMLTRQLIRRGYGRAFPVGVNQTFSFLFSEDEDAARQMGAGLWSACN